MSVIFNQPQRRKVFVSYHHSRDQVYADTFREFYGTTNTIIDRSLPEPLNSDDNDFILSQIRTRHLKDSTVTIVLIGAETWSRKWIDWEIYSSLRPYGNRTINGLLGILLPNSTRLPERFEHNYNEIYNYWSRQYQQVGYARLVRWNRVGPPNWWNTPLRPLYINNYYNDITRRRNELFWWIEEAFKNRANTNLINNTAPRFKYNRPT